MNSAVTPLVRIPVGVVIERHRASSPWIDFTWRAVGILEGVPDASPWTVLSASDDVTRFYGGSADIELYRTETALYRDNLASGSPGLWVVMIPTDADPPYKLLTVTADPAEGEGLTESAANIVEQVPMPASVVQVVERFIAQHHVEREFIKRKRDRADPNALSRRGYGDHDE